MVRRLPMAGCWPHPSIVLRSKPMVYTPWRSSDDDTSWPCPERSRANNAAEMAPANWTPVEWSPIPPR